MGHRIEKHETTVWLGPSAPGGSDGQPCGLLEARGRGQCARRRGDGQCNGERPVRSAPGRSPARRLAGAADCDGAARLRPPTRAAGVPVEAPPSASSMREAWLEPSLAGTPRRPHGAQPQGQSSSLRGPGEQRRARMLAESGHDALCVAGQASARLTPASCRADMRATEDLLGGRVDLPEDFMIPPSRSACRVCRSAPSRPSGSCGRIGCDSKERSRPMVEKTRHRSDSLDGAEAAEDAFSCPALFFGSRRSRGGRRCRTFLAGARDGEGADKAPAAPLSPTTWPLVGSGPR